MKEAFILHFQDILIFKPDAFLLHRDALTKVLWSWDLIGIFVQWSILVL